MSDEVVPELAWMMGRPVRYGGEFGGVNERANYMAEIAARALAPIEIENSAQFERRIVREPHGVVFVIAPWNYPYMTAINTVVPALIAGNTVVLKHATQTLLVGERMVRAFHEAGVPEDVFINLFLDHQTTRKADFAGSFDFINFTGSVGGGKAIERRPPAPSPVGLELGGKDPGYVMEDADLDWAVDTLMDGAMFNAGQCCCGIERLYVAARSMTPLSRRPRPGSVGPQARQSARSGHHDRPDGQCALRAEVRARPRRPFSAGARGPDRSETLFPADDGGAYLMPQILST
jgi:acyl-CoA reductase-like NAD-dependent aldehyde dehydrogenase